MMMTATLQLYMKWLHGELIRILSDFDVIPEEKLIMDIIKGKTYVCEMFEPSKGLLLVIRDGYGWSWSFTPGAGSGYVCHRTQKLIDEWIEKVATMNFPTNIPGQMHFEFVRIMEQFSKMDAATVKKFLAYAEKL